MCYKIRRIAGYLVLKKGGGSVAFLRNFGCESARLLCNCNDSKKTCADVRGKFPWDTKCRAREICRLAGSLFVRGPEY